MPLTPKAPLTARLLRILLWSVALLLLLFGAAQALLRFVVLPQVDRYRDDIARAMSSAIQHPVVIGRVSGRMEGVRPRLDLAGLSITDDAGRAALSLDNVSAVVSWSSLLKLTLYLHRLQIDSPVLAVRRDAAGQLYVAGLPIKESPGGPDLSAWVLDQHNIVIRNARVEWTDEKRNAPPLVLDQLDLRLTHALLHHRFGLTARPPRELASGLDVRGEFTGDSLDTIREWKGQLYAKVDNVDLAGWRAWLDYPVAVEHGRGSATVWLDFAQLRATAITADLGLTQVRARLAPALAMLDLQRLSGRITARVPDKIESGYELSTRQLTLVTADGIDIPPTDLHVSRDARGGDFGANRLDFVALTALAAHLPLPAELREQLAAYAPQGELRQLQVRWRGQRWPFEKYTVSGTFDRLGIAAVNGQPGFGGASGTILGDQSGGSVTLAARQATLVLPHVFPQPLGFDTLDGAMRWKRSGEETELEFPQARFRNADAEGTASGRYRIHAKGAGSIDLEARLTHAEATAVWRYIPLQAGVDTAPFLQRALKQGKASDVTLKLEGDLDRFPFADRSGTFRVQGTVRDGVLRYAEDWPQIEGIAGTLDFNGPSMTITAQEARILGVRVAPAKAVIPDLGVHDVRLTVEGKAAGPTAAFLKFIEASPVGGHIDHATREMSATGDGALDLKLMLPLTHLDAATVAGSYRVDNNRVVLGPGVPPLENVQGRLDFTERGLRAKGVSAVMLGLPLRVDLQSQQDGGVDASIAGDINAAQLQQRFRYAGLRSLSGSARWSGRLAVRKKAIDLRVTSDLTGLASTLPAPFGKSARDALPLLIEYKPADLRVLTRKQRDGSVRQVADVTLGREASPVLRGQFLYRDDGGRQVFERGLVGIGDFALRLPERGIAVAIVQPRVDLDLWRRLLDDGKDDKAASAGVKAAPVADDLVASRIDLRAAELVTAGRNFHDARITAARRMTLQSGQVAATLQAPIWNIDVASREVAAKLEWNAESGSAGKLSGRVMRFAPPPANDGEAVTDSLVRKLPDLDLTFDHLVRDGRDYGLLKLAAENKGGDWNATFTVTNDDGTLEGQGRWRLPPVVPASETRAEFKLHANSIERLLNRAGYPNVVKRGSADLTGKLMWKGAPQDFDIATLSGELNLDARNGQFSKLEPGVGRLLGIMSLQSLPRRISLDFRDIFSQGFAFDSIRGDVAVKNGVLSTQNMEIRGPAAKVQMAGSANVNDETQDLKVRVQPALSETAAVGVLLVHPAVGAGAWAFNKLFGSPLDNVFAYDYAVTGSWSDPKVEKVGAQRGPAKEETP